MPKRKVTLIEGDGIGPEIIASVKKIFAAAEVPIEWEEENAGERVFETKGEFIPQSLIESIKRNKIALKGPITTPVGHGFQSINVQLRQMFDLYQNLRPCKTTVGVRSRFENVDLVIFRENTEGLYAGLSFYDKRLGISDSIARVSKHGCYRIVKAAFEYARKNNRKKVTSVHKANIIKEGGRIFLEAGQEVSLQYPDIAWDDKIIDNMSMQLVLKPEMFDVIVTTNLFGDILSDLCAGLVGGLGVVAGANIGDEVAIFEAVHGSAPDIAGKDLANPTAVLRSAFLMLNYMDLNEYSERIEKALNLTLIDTVSCTGDLGGKGTTSSFTEKIIRNLEK